MNGEWGSAAIVVAIAAAGISLLSASAALWAAWVSHRMMKRQTESDKPTIDCRLSVIENGWLRLQIILENPTISTWVSLCLRVRKPSGTLAANQNETHTRDSYGGYAIDPEKLASVTGSEAALNIEVLPAGSGAASWSHQSRGDRNWGIVYLRPPDSARRLLMELVVESLDGIPRVVTYRIQRATPEMVK